MMHLLLSKVSQTGLQDAKEHTASTKDGVGDTQKENNILEPKYSQGIIYSLLIKEAPPDAKYMPKPSQNNFRGLIPHDQTSPNLLYFGADKLVSRPKPFQGGGYAVDIIPDAQHEVETMICHEESKDSHVKATKPKENQLEATWIKTSTKSQANSLANTWHIQELMQPIFRGISRVQTTGDPSLTSSTTLRTVHSTEWTYTKPKTETTSLFILEPFCIAKSKYPGELEYFKPLIHVQRPKGKKRYEFKKVSINKHVHTWILLQQLCAFNTYGSTWRKRPPRLAKAGLGVSPPFPTFSFLAF